MTLPATNTFDAQSVPDGAQRLLQALAECSYKEQQMDIAVKNLLTEYPLSPDDYPVVAKGYSRTILYRDHSGFEALVARWSKGAVTPIHGHPQFTFVYIVTGELKMEFFEKNGNLVRNTGTHIFRPGEYFYSAGSVDAYDNAIHRVSASADSLSFHIYSDNALKGEIFS